MLNSLFGLSIISTMLPNVYDPGWWYTYPSEKSESQLGLLFPTEWKVIKFHGSKPPTSNSHGVLIPI